MFRFKKQRIKIITCCNPGLDINFEGLLEPQKLEGKKIKRKGGKKIFEEKFKISLNLMN